jgi:hypothetical protein
MIAPHVGGGKSLPAIEKTPQIQAKWPAADHELVKSPHNKAQFPSIAGHRALG